MSLMHNQSSVTNPTGTQKILLRCTAQIQLHVLTYNYKAEAKAYFWKKKNSTGCLHQGLTWLPKKSSDVGDLSLLVAS